MTLSAEPFEVIAVFVALYLFYRNEPIRVKCGNKSFVIRLNPSLIEFGKPAESYLEPDSTKSPDHKP